MTENETFIPNEVPEAVMLVPAAESIDTRVGLELQRLQTQPEFMQLMMNSATYDRAAQQTGKLTTPEEMFAAVELFANVKLVEKAAETMRKDLVAFPNMLAKTFNAMFKGIGVSCGRAKDRLNKEIVAFREKEKVEHAAKVEAAAKAEAEAKAIAEKKLQEQMELPADEREPLDAETTNEIVSLTPEVPEAPANALATSSGKTVHGRMVRKVEVTDKLAFLKAVVSKGKATERFTLDMVDVNMAQMRTLTGKTGEKVKKIPGVKVWDEEVMV